MNREMIAETIVSLCRDRAPDKTICPSEVARVLSDDGQNWRSMMDDVRDVAADLAERGVIDVCQKGFVVDIHRARGPIRLRLKDGRSEL